LSRKARITFTLEDLGNASPQIADRRLYSYFTKLQHTRDALMASAKANTGDNASARFSNATKAMIDNKGWRKRIGNKSKDLHPIKTDCDDTVVAPPVDNAVDLIDQRRHGWRKTIAVSRPVTPMAPISSVPTLEDANDTRSVRSEVSTPRPDSKPKRTRYTSLFTIHKGKPTDPIFSEPWSTDRIPDIEDPWYYVDPIVVAESIHSHMCKSSMVPIPPSYNSGLFRIFDDYRKLRSQNESLETRELEAREQARVAIARMLESEAQYISEIRCLELLIAQGTTGLSG
jgi:hypothetical protein